MELKTKSVSELDVSAPSFLFVGGPGTGKTTLIGQAATFLTKKRGGQFLTLVMDPKKAYPPAFLSCPTKVLMRPKWVEIQQVFTAEYRNYTAGIAVDDLHYYAAECMYDLQGIAGIDRTNFGESHVPMIRQWQIMAARMENHIASVVDRGIPIIYTGRYEVTKDEKSGETYKNVNIGGQSAINVPPLFSVVGLMEYSQTGGGDVFEVKLRPERGFPSRDTSDKLGAREPANFEHIWSKLLGEPCQHCLTKATKPSAVAAVKTA